METKQNETRRSRGPYLSVLIADRDRVPMAEALRRADEAGLVIASHRRLSSESGGMQERFSGVHMCWSGTLVAYEKPGKKLGENIEFTDFSGTMFLFPVPRIHRGKSDIALVAEHPDFTITGDGRARRIDAPGCEALERFPASNGWYLCDMRYGIPHGERVESVNADASLLFRSSQPWVGLVPYADHTRLLGRRAVQLTRQPCEGMSVLVESPSKLSVREESGRLIVEGTPEQIAAAAGLLRRLSDE